MPGYDRDEPEDYDDYGDEGEGGEEYEEDEVEEYEEEASRKPTKEEHDYLELRQKLKESIRKKMKQENNTSRTDSSARMKKLPYDNYGSFFGPSQPVIAQRVIQESKSLLENRHLVSRVSSSSHANKNSSKVSNGVSKSSAHIKLPKINEKQVKAQKLKATRDYSFLLSDDADVPAPAKKTPPQNKSVHNSDRRPTKFAGNGTQSSVSKQSSVSGSKLVRGSGGDRKPVAGAGSLVPKSGSNHKLTANIKSSKPMADSRKQLGSNSGNGPGRPVGPKGLPSKMPVSTMVNKSLTPGVRNPVNGVQKPLPPKAHSSVPRQQSMEQRKDVREQNKPKIIPKQPVTSSKAQINKPQKQIQKHSDLQDHRPKNKVRKQYSDNAEDEMDVSRMIRSMFNYNPNRFVDDDDDDNMEAGFDEILMEERRSSIIAKKEDEEQLRLIEEEEERERRRRMSKLKKRKLGD